MTAPANRAAQADPIGPFGIASIAASGVFLALGLGWPQAAGALLRLFLATLAVGFVLARAYEAMRPARGDEPYSPFDGYDPGSRRVAPRALHEMTRRLAAADDPDASPRTPIPVSVERALIDAAEQRLSNHYGLKLEDPADRAAIRARVSELLWQMIGRGTVTEPTAEPATHPGAAPDIAPGRPLPVSRLGPILDELERL